MGLFKGHSRRESSDSPRWPFKPTDYSADAQRRHQTRQSFKISSPVLIESSRNVSHLPAAVTQSAPLQQMPWQPAPATSGSFTEHSFEPLFHDCYVSPVEERVPVELSAAAHAARFHDYIKDLSSKEPSVHLTELSDKEDDDDDLEEVEEVDDLQEAQQATTVCLASPGKPKIIHLSSFSPSLSSTNSASSSVSDVRVSAFLRSRSPSNASQCETPYTPQSFFDSTGEAPSADALHAARFARAYGACRLDLPEKIIIPATGPTSFSIDELHTP